MKTSTISLHRHNSHRIRKSGDAQKLAADFFRQRHLDLLLKRALKSSPLSVDNSDKQAIADG